MAADTVQSLLKQTWRDRDSLCRPLTPADVLIVTPYNAQTRDIEEALESRGVAGVRVGTVDMFQGREAPVVLYSMASSSADDAPRGMGFLYDSHRLNVATSRARAMAVVIGNAELPRVRCRTIDQMLLANALCRTWEVARS